MCFKEVMSGHVIPAGFKRESRYKGSRGCPIAAVGHDKRRPLSPLLGIHIYLRA